MEKAKENKLTKYLKSNNGFHNLIKDFFTYLKNENLQIYNEFSFQYELGIFLRNLDETKEYKIEFERNIKSVLKNEIFKEIQKNYESDITEGKTKREIDIYIKHMDKEKYAVELKFPKNGGYPDEMYEFVKDIKFMQILKNYGFTKTFCVTVVGLEEEKEQTKYNPRLFYEGKSKENHIFRYFRECKEEEHFPQKLENKIYKNKDSEKYPTLFVDVGDFGKKIEWLLPYSKEKGAYYNKNARYYVLEIDKETKYEKTKK